MPRASTHQRRAQILEGLKQVFAQSGYAGASMRAVADAAGLTPGLLHYHFPNKRAMLVGLIGQLQADLLARVPQELLGRAAIETVVDALLDVEQADPAALACWVQARGEAQRDPVVGAAYRTALEAIIDRLLPAFDALGAGRAEAVGLLAAVEGYFGLAATCTGLVPAGSAASMTRAMLGGLLP